MMFHRTTRTLCVFRTLYHNLRNCCSKSGPKSKMLLRSALEEKRKIELIPFRVTGCSFGDSFSNAELVVDQFLVDIKGNVKSPKLISEEDILSGEVGTYGVNFESLFSKGFDALRAHLLNGGVVADPEFVSDPFQNSLHHACGTLLNFLSKSDYHGRCLSKLDDKDSRNSLGTETLITALLANHLLSRLARDKVGGYFISNDSRSKVATCPCKDRDCNEDILYGGSGFGSTYLWHGQPDIMLFPGQAGASFNVVVPSSSKQTYLVTDWEDEDTQVLNVEEDSSPLRNKNNIRQIVAQTITFSFFQQKFLGIINTDTHLVPTIAVCSDSFDIYMYDTKNDILLRNEGDPIQFRNRGDLCLSSVVTLWILINHLFVRSALDGHKLNLLRGSCGLQKYVNEQYLNKIDQTMSMMQRFESTKMSELTDLPRFNELEL